MVRFHYILADSNFKLITFYYVSFFKRLFYNEFLMGEYDMNIPEGYMLVSVAWSPIISEIEHRGSKMDGTWDDFEVLINHEDYQAVLDSEAK